MTESGTKNNPDFLLGNAAAAARSLLGWTLERDIDGQLLRARIVETEAYDQTDIASHTYNGETARNSVMFGPAGRLYVYFTYGMHYCCNVVVGPRGHGAAVLLRAAEPLANESLMAKRRKRGGIEIANGPAKLCQALGIDASLNGHNLQSRPLRLLPPDNSVEVEVITTTRVGISKAKDVPWRFYIKDNPHVSRV